MTTLGLAVAINYLRERSFSEREVKELENKLNSDLDIPVFEKKGIDLKLDSKPTERD